MLIRPAVARELVDLRSAVLRPGLPRELATFDADDDPSTRHFAAEDDGAIVGCATLELSKTDDESAWQLRGMAVASSHRGRGIGAKLLATVDQSIGDSAPDLPRLLWCNARVPAVPFYERQGWRVVSGVYEIPHSGPHVKMVKRLDGAME